jgi:hypothetical protein
MSANRSLPRSNRCSATDGARTGRIAIIQTRARTSVSVLLLDDLHELTRIAVTALPVRLPERSSERIQPARPRHSVAAKRASRITLIVAIEARGSVGPRISWSLCRRLVGVPAGPSIPARVTAITRLTRPSGHADRGRDSLSGC